MVIGDPLSLTGFTKSAAIWERPDTAWRARTETTTKLWSEAAADGYVFRYRATVETYIGDGKGQDQPFAQKAVEGPIERSW
jgi:hypothetical protein